MMDYKDINIRDIRTNSETLGGVINGDLAQIHTTDEFTFLLVESGYQIRLSKRVIDRIVGELVMEKLKSKETKEGE